MKKLLLAVIFIVLFFGVAFADAPFHIGIMTQTVSQSEDQYRGAELLVKEYGAVSDGGYINQLTTPDNFMTEMETTITQITSYASDPLMKAIVVVEAIPGVVEAFRRVRETRPDILLFAGSPAEDPRMISDVADLSVGADMPSMGYIRALEAKKLGADTVVFITFPRHMSYELISVQNAIMKVACEDMGLKFYTIGAPDPVSDVGVAGTQQFILEKVPAWIEQYGKNTAFYTSNIAIEEPLMKRVAEFGAIYVDSVPSSTLVGWPGAFGVNSKNQIRVIGKK